jgi:hypothetical protein
MKHGNIYLLILVVCNFVDLQQIKNNQYVN